MSGEQSMRHATLHDVELAGLAGAGDRGAFGELVRRHGPAVRALVRRMGAASAEADDVAQDAFLAAFENIADYRGEGAFAGWVKRIAVRQYLRRLRRTKRLAEIGAESVEPVVTGGGVESLAAGRIDLDAALSGLTLPERLSVGMCYGAGLSHAEAAEALNLPLGTVKSHVKRGLEKLRVRLVSAPNVEAKGSVVHG